MADNMANGRLDKRRCVTLHRYLPVISHRYLLAFMLSLGVLAIIAIRTSFALIMTHVTTVNQSSTNLIFSHCPVSNTSADVTVDMRGDVMLMSHTALYVGVGVVVLPGGIASTIVSTKLVAGICMLLNGVVALLFPFAIVYSTPLVFLLRGLEGAFDGIIQSAFYAVLSAWSTEADRTTLFSILVVGFYFAPAVSSLLTALTVCFIRWDAAFYILGGTSLLWTVVWFRFFYETPDLHPNLTSEERILLRKYGGNVQKSSIELFKNAPWRSIMTSRGVWAVINAVAIRTAIYAILLLEQPQYFQDSFDIKIEDLGILLVLPYLLLGVTSFLGGLFSDKLLRLGLSITVTRKLIFTIGYVTEGVFLLMLYFTWDWLTVYIFLTVGACLEGFGSAGYYPLISDMCPQYTGLIFGLTDTLGVGVVGVLVTTFISMTSGRSQSLESWQNIFLLMAVMHFVGCAIFALTADASLQPWAQGTKNVYTACQAADDTDDEESEESDSLQMVDMSAKSLLAPRRNLEKNSLEEKNKDGF
ncbi:hypothetical protein ACOMHN_046754 [Nucella lapillus]